MNISIVITVLNEEVTINRLLKSLYFQSITSKELIIVDGGSTDKTIEKINSFAKKHKKLTIHLIKEFGNISHGRNVGIKSANNEIIAITDAGCIAKKDWLENITSPFTNPKVDLVAGFYEMNSESLLQTAVAPFLGVTKRNFDYRSYLPSARSIAFRKKVWNEVGGFNEELERTGEDTLFNYEVIKRKIEIRREPNALVVWEVPNSWKQILNKFYSYSKGDAEAGIWWHPAQGLRTHNIKIVTIFIRYILFLFLFMGGLVNSFLMFLFIFAVVLYSSWSISKMCKDVSEIKALLLVPVIQVASDISVMAGFIAGLYNKSI